MEKIMRSDKAHPFLFLPKPTTGVKTYVNLPEDEAAVVPTVYDVHQDYRIPVEIPKKMPKAKKRCFPTYILAIKFAFIV
jgi:hypothetical protein